jgi:hypothetical protein
MENEMNTPNIKVVPRSKEEIGADFKVLLNEITAKMDTMGDCGSAPMAMCAVRLANPDLDKRYKNLMAEANDLEEMEAAHGKST